MQLKVPLSPNATIDRALARAVVAGGLWAAAGGMGRSQAELRINGPLQDKVAAEVALIAFCDRLLVWAAETGRLIAPGFCEGEGAIEVEAGELIGDSVDAVADACPSA
jgi:hypothetical protein